MYWANFLHVYQPPTQKPYWVKRVAKESYIKIIEGLKQYPRAKITLNINAVLTELLVKHGFPGIVRDLAMLARRGQIEFTESAKYHPLLPKIPESEMVRQIKLNAATNKKYFGNVWNPKGFFPPEMGFSKQVASVAKKLGYQWVIADELSYPGSPGNINWSTIYLLKGFDTFAIFFRDRSVSFKILSAQLGTGSMLRRELKKRFRSAAYLVTAMDGETFGHHRPGLEKLLYDLWKSQDIPTVTISDLPNLCPNRELVTPRPSTWALMDKDRERRIPFARWDDPDNEIHTLQWQLTRLAFSTIAEANPQRKGWKRARAMVDRSVHSDQYWWASARPWWSLEMIEAGAKDLRDAIGAIPSASLRIKKRADALYTRIIARAFEWQRSGKVEALAKREDEEIRQRMDADRPFVAEEDFRQMVGTLERQMKEAVKHQEFERAAQFRDRILELKEERSLTFGDQKRTRKKRSHSHEKDWGA